MKILICGPEGSGKTMLAKPFATLLGGVYIDRNSYTNELRGYVDGIVAAGKTVVIDKRCNTNEAVEYLDPDYIVWMDTIKEGRFADTNKMFENPTSCDYHVKEWFTDTHQQLSEVIKNYMEKQNV